MQQRERWAPQWTDDERLCIRTVTNTVHIYRNGEFAPGAREALPVEKLGAAFLAPVWRVS